MLLFMDSLLGETETVPFVYKKDQLVNLISSIFVANCFFQEGIGMDQVFP